jgi:hypothetical protein
VLPLATLLLVVGLCGGCLWWGTEQPRFSQQFDIGGGRTLTVWSATRTAGLQGWINFQPGPSPLMVYYRIDADGREVTHTTFLDHDDKGEYEFRMVSAEGGRLVCVYEVSRYVKNSYMVLLYDEESGESWPRDRGGYLGAPPDKDKKWRERFERIRREHPGFTTPHYLAQQ